jgi:hypothetical protein
MRESPGPDIVAGGGGRKTTCDPTECYSNKQFISKYYTSSCKPCGPARPRSSASSARYELEAKGEDCVSRLTQGPGSAIGRKLPGPSVNGDKSVLRASTPESGIIEGLSGVSRGVGKHDGLVGS